MKIYISRWSFADNAWNLHVGIDHQDALSIITGENHALTVKLIIIHLLR
jgi:hypothetical protein